MRFDFSHTRIIIRPGTTNMLASKDQLLEIIKNIMKDDPFNGAVFLFCNRSSLYSRKTMKLQKEQCPDCSNKPEK